MQRRSNEDESKARLIHLTNLFSARGLLSEVKNEWPEWPESAYLHVSSALAEVRLALNTLHDHFGGSVERATTPNDKIAGQGGTG